MRKASVLAFVLLLQGCVFLPVTVEAYDPACRVVQRQMTLQPVQLAAISGCGNGGCAALLGGAGVTAAASLVVSGSIAIIGNVVYWLERQGASCQPPLPPPVA